MTAHWTELPLCSVDTETTGIDPFSDRIVEVGAVQVDPDGFAREPWSRIIDPGVEIPGGAANVHGITTERAQAEGVEPAKALTELAERMWRHIEEHQGQAAFTMFNARFDWPLILTEAERHQVDLPCFAGILDPYLVDRLVGQRRKGKRTLSLVAEHYKVELGDAAHGAAADATAAGQVMWEIVRRHPAELVNRSLASLWLWQVRGHEDDRTQFQDWMRRNVDRKFLAIPGWPIPIRPEPKRESDEPSAPRPGHQTANDSDADPVLAQEAAGATGSATGPPAADFVPMSDTQNRRVHALISKARPGQDRHGVMTELLGREITSARQLTVDDAERIVEVLDAEAKAAS